MTQLDAKPPPTEAEVLAALAAYRAHILDQNYQIIIQDIIPELQAQEHEEDDDPEIGKSAFFCRSRAPRDMAARAFAHRTH